MSAAPRPHRLLISYHYFRRLKVAEWLRDHFDGPARVFADSGAFSAKTQGAQIDRAEFADWCKANASSLTVVSNLDVIGNAKASRDNLYWLRGAGVPAMPVFHAGEPWEYFDAYVKEFDYIALGGLVGWSANKLMPFFRACFDRAKRLESRTVFHGFGMTGYEGVLAFPWYSCDSSSWQSSFMYAKLKLFDPLLGRFRVVTAFDAKDVMANAHLLRVYGVDPSQVIARPKESGAFYRMAAALSARSWIEFENFVRRRRGTVAHPAGEDAEGFHLYLASGAKFAHAAANKSLAGWKPRVSARAA